MEAQYFLIRVQFYNNTFMSGLCKGLRSEIEISAGQRGDRTSKSPGDKVQLWGPPGKHRLAPKEVVADCHWKNEEKMHHICVHVTAASRGPSGSSGYGEVWPPGGTAQSGTAESSSKRSGTSFQPGEREEHRLWESSAGVRCKTWHHIFSFLMLVNSHLCVFVFCRLQKDFAQYKSELNVILEKEKTMTSDLTERLEDEKRQHANTRKLLEQVHHNQTLNEIFCKIRFILILTI